MYASMEHAEIIKKMTEEFDEVSATHWQIEIFTTFPFIKPERFHYKLSLNSTVLSVFCKW